MSGIIVLPEVGEFDSAICNVRPLFEEAWVFSVRCIGSPAESIPKSSSVGLIEKERLDFRTSGFLLEVDCEVFESVLWVSESD